MLASPTIRPEPDCEQASTAEVWLTELMLSDFRNYDTLRLDLDHRPVVLTGQNGAGKTNLMEAVSLLAPGRGLRHAKRERLARRSRLAAADAERDAAGQWAVSARIQTADGPFQAGTGVMEPVEAERPRRSVRIDGEAASQADLAERLGVSWLTPEMDQILASSPSERRRFLDRLVIAFDPAHSGRLQRHEKAARQRGRLLDEGRGDDAWFDALEAEMASSGVAIVAARKALVEALDREASLPVPAFPSARLRLEGQAEDWMDGMPAIDVEDRIREEARTLRGAGRKTVPGASESVLVATHSGTGQDAELCSTGEQKALIVSIVLGHARLQTHRLMRPLLLLLDDIASHLDERRRAALFELVDGMPGQVWFSGTDAGDFETILRSGQHVPIAGGRVANGHASGATPMGSGT